MKRFTFIFPKLRNFAVGIWFWWSINNLVKPIYLFITTTLNDYLWEIITIFMLSFMVRLTMILLYDYFKIDFFLIEEMKQKKGIADEENHITKRIKKLRKRGEKILTFGLVSFDPFITAIYFRTGDYEWNGLKGKKAQILFVISNAVAALTVTLGINFLLYLFTKAGF